MAKHSITDLTMNDIQILLQCLVKTYSYIVILRIRPIPIKENFHSRIIIIHILNMCRNNIFVKQVLERKAFVRGREYTGEEHISLVNLNKCCDLMTSLLTLM